MSRTPCCVVFVIMRGWRRPPSPEHTTQHAMVGLSPTSSRISWCRRSSGRFPVALAQAKAAASARGFAAGFAGGFSGGLCFRAAEAYEARVVKDAAHAVLSVRRREEKLSTATQVRAMRAIALRALLVAAAAHALMADDARTDCSAHTHSSHTEPRTPSTMAMADERVQHTSTRRSTALLSTLHTIAMRTPDCLLDGTMLREHAHLTMVADRNSMAATPNTPRTKMPLRSRCCPPCFCARLVPHANFPALGALRALLIARFGPMAPATSRTLQPACTTPTASRPTEATPGFVGRHYQYHNISHSATPETPPLEGHGDARRPL